MGKAQLAVVGLVTVALIAAYVIVTVTNHDGTGLLGALIGWLGGAGVAPAIDRARVTPQMAPRLSTMSSVELTVGCRAVFEALDPSTLAPVSGVKITNPTIYGVNVTPEADTSPAAKNTAVLLPGPAVQVSAQPQPETPQQIVNSAKGWSAFTRVLSRTVPTQLYYSQTARYGIRSLIRHGR